MTQEEPKTMNGLEALAYLNEKRGERFVKDSDGEVYKFCPENGDIYLYTLRFSSKWALIGHSTAQWIDSTFTACPDPSHPVESEYEKDKNRLIRVLADTAKTDNFKAERLVEHLEKYYQCKDPK